MNRYIPPHFGEVALTVEKQKEQSKVKKKAKIEKEKAAVRAEEMAKGVYPPALVVVCKTG